MKYSFGSFVRHAIASHLRLPDVCVEPSQRLREDLGLLPLDLVLIALSLEDVAGIRFPIERIESVCTVEELTRFLWSCRYGSHTAFPRREDAPRVAEPRHS